MSLGGPPPVCSEIRSALYPQEKRPQVVSVVGGLGGRDISPDDFEKLIDIGLGRIKFGDTAETIMFGVRE
jgi:pyruvate ferredoxin oxidoreductase alpha subunit